MYLTRQGFKKMSIYHKTIFPSGLRLVTIPIRGSKTDCLLVLVGTGSKYEKAYQAGISHFLEHMLFKGTKKRPTARSISETLDAVGGEYNAFTSKEYTGFYAKVASRHINLAFDVISDILLNSKMETGEIRREKNVICEEINMYQDTPRVYVTELFEKLLYKNQPAGRLVIGSKKTVKMLKRQDLLDYFSSSYLASNIVVCVAGNISFQRSVELTKKYFVKVKRGEAKTKKRTIEQQKRPEILCHFQKTDQTHFCLGVRGYDLFHPQKYSIKLLSVILGGGMSSRLFTEIRERRGLAYYISCDSEYYTDSGYLVVHAGVDNKKVCTAISICLSQFRKICQEGVTPKELSKAKEYIKGKTLLNLETSDDQAIWFGMQEILEKRIETVKEKFAKIDAVKAIDIQKVAQDIFKNNKLNLTLIGPFKNKDRFLKILKL